MGRCHLQKTRQAAARHAFSMLVLVGCAGLAPKVNKRLAALWFCPSARGRLSLASLVGVK